MRQLAGAENRESGHKCRHQAPGRTDPTESRAVDRKLKHAGTPYLLKGKLVDSAGNRMTPSHTVKKGVRYAIMSPRPS
jgi:hypothetical protein